jgi:hypothetical protein
MAITSRISLRIALWAGAHGPAAGRESDQQGGGSDGRILDCANGFVRQARGGLNPVAPERGNRENAEDGKKHRHDRLRTEDPGQMYTVI